MAGSDCYLRLCLQFKLKSRTKQKHECGGLIWFRSINYILEQANCVVAWVIDAHQKSYEPVTSQKPAFWRLVKFC